MSLIAEASDLTIQNGDPAVPIKSLSFVLTPSALLCGAIMLRSPARSTARRRTEVVRPGVVCGLPEQTTISFRKSFRRSTPGAKYITEFLADVRTSHEPDLASATKALDDTLLLASFAERNPLYWIGWRLERADGTRSEHYRRTSSLREHSVPSIDDTLISLREIESFLNSTVPVFQALPRNSSIERAIWMALHGQRSGISDSFMMMFSGIECLLARYNQEVGIEVIVEQGWKQLRSNLRKWLAIQSEVTALDTVRQQFLYAKIGELNRVSFAEAFLQMTGSVDLSDLWSIVGNEPPTLSRLRNRIVHGFPFDTAQEFAMVSAKYHLLWTLERLLLDLLGWPVGKSRVDKRSLAGLTLYGQWRNDRRILAAI